MSSSSDTQILREPVLFNRFEVVRTLGQGAAGTVYQVKDRSQGHKLVALKVLTDMEAFDENTLRRFKDEFLVCQKIRHPNLVEAYDFFELGSAVAFSMEYISGVDLGRLFEQRHLKYEEIEPMFSDILSALHELHKQGVVHRDLKLENILVADNGVAKLSDLGLLKKPQDKGLTKTGILLGTAPYFPPEYIKRSRYDQRGDIYALGIMLWELLTHKRWLHDKRGMEAIEHLIKTKFKIPEITMTGLPEKFKKILRKALDPDPEKRYQTVLEMRDAFRNSEEQSQGKNTELKVTINIHDYAEDGLVDRASRALRIWRTPLKLLLILVLSLCAYWLIK